ncbi:glycerate kinase [Leucobacter insecticola]|uniref:Glycerate kinase n=1 Tax=Leucobacter insecticola TaxID=2714934 RepID=A0A6G8FGW1_9MICO|nr:glycerate kinase [Leucobacter insecticola]QIM15509.1 glycerate kinase [Leucobacter insecticola]
MTQDVTIVAVAPDSFKGSCTSAEAASALAEGVRLVIGERAAIREIPMADGGEGTLATLVSAWQGEVIEVPTTDALGRPRRGRIGSGLARQQASTSDSAARIAIIETADANGLPAVSDQPLQPLDADSGGVGRLIRAALDTGATEILLCLGGSATSDGGAGMLRELGARLLDNAGVQIRAGARDLTRLARIDLTGIDSRLRAIAIRVACDVDNPLTGPRGAAAVFGPQKGADAAAVERIDAGLARFAEVLAHAAQQDPTVLQALPGLGAAGGLALGLVALFNAELVPGSELVSESIGLRDALAGADLIITGEGRLDAQSFDGKVVSRIRADAEPGTPVIVVAGSLGISAHEAREAGITAAFSIAPGPRSLAELQRECLELLAETAAHATSLFIAARQ